MAYRIVGFTILVNGIGIRSPNIGVEADNRVDAIRLALDELVKNGDYVEPSDVLLSIDLLDTFVDQLGKGECDESNISNHK
jgi:hypothetical protein